MNVKHILIATAAAAFAAGSPVLAQMQNDSMSKDAMSSDKGAMSSGSGMKMTMAQKKKMASCQKMSHAAMMKDKGCMQMMKMHPDMMKGG